MRSNLSLINVYKNKSLKSEVVTQLLYGETFKKLKKFGSWIKIKNDSDNYRGYIKFKKYLPNQKNSHKIFNLNAQLYSKPSFKYKVKNKLSFNSRIRVTKKVKKFYGFDNLWIKKSDVKKINHKTKFPFSYIKKFINVKYKWGGKHYTGMDCSAIIQLCLNYNNRFCPRDSKDQMKYFKRKIKLEKIKKNDLIFWKGHVALIISRKKAIHAYGPFKKVVVMPTRKIINRILKTANLKVISIKRI